MFFFETLTTAERRLIAVCLIGLMICATLLMGYDEYIWGGHQSGQRLEVVGRVVLRKNDARLKSLGEFSWRPARRQAEVRKGDSVFTGDQSELEIDLDNGGKVSLGEYSLVTFKEKGNETLVDLVDGSFKLKLKDDVKVAIAGKVTTITGKNSEVEIFIDKDEKPKVRLLKGQARISKADQVAVKLEDKKVAPLSVIEDTPLLEAPSPLPTKPEYVYIWKLDDLYERDGLVLYPKTVLPREVEANVPVSWAIRSKTAKKFVVQLSGQPDMRGAIAAPAEGTDATLRDVHVGDNFWRVMIDNGVWSDIQKFFLATEFLPDAEPRLTARNEKIDLLDDVAYLPVALSAPVAASGFVVEASSNSEFRPDRTRTFWSSQAEFRLSFYQSGVYYYRFRTVDGQERLSDWSSTLKIAVEVPPLLPEPRLLSAITHGDVHDRFDFSWAPLDGAMAYRLQIFDESGGLAESRQNKRSDFIWVPTRPGSYRAYATGVDRFGRLGTMSDPVSLKVSAKKIIQAQATPVPTPRPELEKIERGISSTGTNTMRMTAPKRHPLNERYSTSKLSIEGMTATFFSSEMFSQTEDDASGPITAGLGIRALHWWDRIGLSGFLKSGFLNLGGGDGQGTTTQAEMRAQYRLFGYLPFGLSRSLQLALVGGYELSRSDYTYFASGYDLVKFGTSIEFTLGDYWTTGGEVLYGVGLDSSRKYEASGFIQRFLGRDWSIGLGYRIHLFEAGSLSSSAGVLPYREAYTSGYSILNYHY